MKNKDNKDNKELVDVLPETQETIEEVVGQDPNVGQDETPKTSAPTQPKQLNLTGMVIKCAVLNVRKEPSTSSEVITTIKRGDIVEINETESTDEFYKVITNSDVSGFCMKDFIKVR